MGVRRVCWCRSNACTSRTSAGTLAGNAVCFDIGEVVFQAAGPWALSWSLTWYLWARSITSTCYHRRRFQFHTHKHVAQSTIRGRDTRAPAESCDQAAPASRSVPLRPQDVLDPVHVVFGLRCVRGLSQTVPTLSHGFATSQNFRLALACLVC